MGEITGLPESTQEVLKLAACIGYQFDLHTLSMVCQKPPQQAAASVSPAITANFILPLDQPKGSNEVLASTTNNLHYRFVHDGIQQSLYQSIPEDIKGNIHLKIGRMLLQDHELQEFDDRLFAIMDQFSQCSHLVSDRGEREKLAIYSLWAGRQAKQAASYQAAKRYIQMGITLLEPVDWVNNYKLTFDLYKECAISNYLTGDCKAASHYFDLLAKHAHDALDKLEVCKLNCEMLATLNQHTEAIKLGLSTLRSLQIKIPVKPNRLHILWAILKIKLKIGRRKIAKIELARMSDQHQRAAVDLITQLLNSAFIIDQKLFMLLTCTTISISLKYGYTESASVAITAYAFELIHGLHRYAEGIGFIKLYERLKSTYGEGNFAGKNHFVLGSFIEPWRSPVLHAMQVVAKSAELSYQVGDWVYSNYANLILVLMAFMTSQTLSEVRRQIQHTLAFSAKMNISDFSAISNFWVYTLDCLEDKTSYNNNQINTYEWRILSNKNKTELSFFYSYSARLHYLLGATDEVLIACHKFTSYAEYSLGLINNAETLFYYAMAIADGYATKTWLERYWYWRKLQRLRSTIKRWAQWCPKNFKPYSLMIDARLCTLRKDYLTAAKHYDEAISIARSQNAVYLMAIAYEQAARLLHETHQADRAQEYFTQAHALFKQWGALLKCKQLEQTYTHYTPRCDF
jgi:predicted ATPase